MDCADARSRNPILQSIQSILPVSALSDHIKGDFPYWNEDRRAGTSSRTKTSLMRLVFHLLLNSKLIKSIRRQASVITLEVGHKLLTDIRVEYEVSFEDILLMPTIEKLESYPAFTTTKMNS